MTVVDQRHIQSMEAHPRYIPDLDGLRAVAVLGVLIFHLGVRGVGGGFVGVDVFYVISGFIIFKLIWLQKGAGSFSYISFYTRRARRLIPALMAVIIITAVVSFLLLSPTHFADFAKSAIYSSISAANVNFWLGVSYFDSGKLTKPLLHTWSLSVEEQFYLFWPILVSLLFLVRRGRRAVSIGAISLLAIASFSFMVGFQGAQPSAVFYLTPFRIWQFCCGAVVALAMPSMPSSSDRLKPAATILGLLCIIASFVAVSEVGYPGYQSLLPTIGAALAIAGTGSGLSRQILGNPVFVWVGKRSYALYLVHWPLIVLYHYVTQSPFSIVEVFALGAGSIVLAEALHRFVEEPLRRPWTKGGSTEPLAVGAGLLASLAAVVILSAHVWAQTGWEWRLSPAVSRAVQRMSYDPAPAFECRSVKLPWTLAGCRFGPLTAEPTVLVVGDSHGGRLAAGINDVLGGQGSGYLVKKLGALPAEHAKTFVDGAPHPDDFDDEIEYAAEEWAGDYIFLHGFFSYYWWGDTSYPGYQVRLIGTPGHGPRSIEESQANYVRDIRLTFARLSHAKAKVIVVGSVPAQGVNTPECMRRPSYLFDFNQLLTSCRGIAKEDIIAKAKPINDMLAAEAKAAGLTFIDPLDVFCPPDQADCLRIVDGKFLYSDDNHLNIVGARMLAKYTLDQAAAAPSNVSQRF